MLRNSYTHPYLVPSKCPLTSSTYWSLCSIHHLRILSKNGPVFPSSSYVRAQIHISTTYVDHSATDTHTSQTADLLSNPSHMACVLPYLNLHLRRHVFTCHINCYFLTLKKAVCVGNTMCATATHQISEITCINTPMYKHRYAHIYVCVCQRSYFHEQISIVNLLYVHLAQFNLGRSHDGRQDVVIHSG